MSRVTPDAESLAKLSAATKSVEIADANGNVIGTFVPNASYDRIMSFFLPPLSKEGLAEARAEMLEHGGVSTAEVLAAIDDAKRRWEATR